VLLRTIVIGLTAFLAVVDLFATQAILPTLTRAYHVTPGAMGVAVNASTMGMAIAGLIVSMLSPHIDRRFDGVYAAAHRAGPVHGIRLYADAGLFGRGVQRSGCRKRRGLYHRQCREQSHRPSALGPLADHFGLAQGQPSSVICSLPSVLRCCTNSSRMRRSLPPL
jgi:hypothetical protein